MPGEIDINAVYSLIETTIEKALNDLGLLLQKETYKLIREKGKYATRQLMDSIVYDIVRENEAVFTLKIGTNVPYAKYVDSGRAPGKYPPWNPVTKTFPDIVKWLNIKRVALKPGQTVEDLAFVVAKKIHDKGIDPFPFFKLTVEANIHRIAARLERMAGEINNGLTHE